MCQVDQRCCRLSVSFAGNLLNTCGKTTRVLSTESGKEKGENKGILLCPFCSPLVADVQSAWSLLLHCAGGRAKCLLSMMRPELMGRFALGHNEGLWEWLKRIMQLEGDVSDTVKDITSLPLALGGLGFAVQLGPANQHSGRPGRTASP